MKFLEQRLQATGKEMSDLFYEDPLIDELPPVNLKECDGGQAEEKVLYMRTCPYPLPTKSKSTSAFQSKEAEWLRGWHGAWPYTIFAILDHGALRPGPRRKSSCEAVYQHLDDTFRKATEYSLWVPLFEDGYFYRFVFETRTDDTVKLSRAKDRADQFYGDEASTHLYALHVLRRSAQQMVQHTYFRECWDHKLEVRPLRLRTIMNRSPEHSGPPVEEQSKTKQRSHSIDASMSESVSMSASRDAVKTEREEGVHPSPSTEIDERKVHDQVVSLDLREKKPWLQCGIEQWERFLFEPTHAHLLGAADLEHNKEEWMELYDRCVMGNHQEDVIGLLRLIFAQTGAMNNGNNKMLFPRAGDAELHVTKMSEIAEDLNNWKGNRLPWQRRSVDGSDPIDPRLTSPAKRSGTNIGVR